MDEEAKAERPNRAGMDSPRNTAVRGREMPSVGIVRVGEHYIVHAGCKTAVFHLPSEVGLFLEGLLREWIHENLGGDTRVIEFKENPNELRTVLYREKI